jgi:hypothetical protein
MSADALSHSIHYEDVCYDKHRIVLTQRFRPIGFDPGLDPLGFRANLYCYKKHFGIFLCFK